MYGILTRELGISNEDKERIAIACRGGGKGFRAWRLRKETLNAVGLK